MKTNGKRKVSLLQRGTWVFLKSEFVNGASKPKDKRTYPAGTRGFVKSSFRDGLELIMDDPPGVTYSRKDIWADRRTISTTRIVAA